MSFALIREQFKIKNISALVILVVIMFYVSTQNFVMFHTLIELGCILVAINMMSLSISTYEFNSNYYIVFLGIAYGFVAVLDIGHMLTYEGVGILLKESTDMSAKFWIIARMMESISILIACNFINRNKSIKLKSVLSIFSTITIVIIYVIYFFDFLPTTYIIGKGVTLYKSMVELVIVCVFYLSLIVLIKRREKVDSRTYTYMFFSIVLSIGSELLFINYVDILNVSFVTGHIMKLLSFYFLYKSVIETGHWEPYEKLKRSENKYKLFLNSSPNGIIVVNGSKIQYENKSFREIFKIPTEVDTNTSELFNYLPLECIDVIKDNYDKLSKQLPVGTTELRKLKIKNAELSVELITTLIEHEKETAMLVIFKDIKEKIIAQELEDSKRELEQSLLIDKLKTEFMSNIAHDLKTPLNIILGATQLININSNNDGEGLDHSKQAKYTHMIKQNSYRLLRLINNLIDMTKLDSKSFYMNFERYNIVDIIENITLSVASYVESKGIELTFDTTVEERIICCDAYQIERVLLNLISNSVKFTPKGGSIIVNIYEEANQVCITVQDTGIGIPPEVKERVFDRFRQIDTPFHRKHEGSGIGLSLVKSIIEEHDGNISVKSMVGAGSIFTIKLPTELEYIKNKAIEEIAVSSHPNIERISIEFSDIYS